MRILWMYQIGDRPFAQPRSLVAFPGPYSRYRIEFGEVLARPRPKGRRGTNRHLSRTLAVSFGS